MKATSSPTDKFAVDDCFGAKQKESGAGELADILNGVLPLGAEHGGLERRAHVGRELLLPLLGRDRLDGRRLDRLHPDDGFNEELLAFRAAVEFFVQPFPQQRPGDAGNDEVQGNGCQDDERQLPGVGEQHSDEDKSEEQVERREKGLTREEGADGFQLAHASHRLPGGPRFEIGNRQSRQMTKQALPKFNVDAVCGVG